MEKETFLGIFGIYLLESAIFDYLEIEISQESRYRGEFQLTTALNQLCQNSGSLGYLVQGDYFDTGMPEFYQQAIAQFYPMGS
jgi:UTP--glucose-1-phosphate uridylyltransferase